MSLPGAATAGGSPSAITTTDSARVTVSGVPEARQLFASFDSLILPVSSAQRARSKCRAACSMAP